MQAESANETGVALVLGGGGVLLVAGRPSTQSAHESRSCSDDQPRWLLWLAAAIPEAITVVR